MTSIEFQNKKESLVFNPVKIGFFGIRYLYLDENTRVRYGISLRYLGTTYQLERKNIIWRSVAWTYDLTHREQDMEDIIEYLFWYEEDERPARECKF